MRNGDAGCVPDYKDWPNYGLATAEFLLNDLPSGGGVFHFTLSRVDGGWTPLPAAGWPTSKPFGAALTRLGEHARREGWPFAAEIKLEARAAAEGYYKPSAFCLYPRARRIRPPPSQAFVEESGKAKRIDSVACRMAHLNSGKTR